MDYSIGDVVKYVPFHGEQRMVRVTNKEDDIKNGRPGFDGTVISLDTNNGLPVWGYDEQIISVHKA